MSKMDFLPMPVDAMFDPKLTLAHTRVLAAVALHDRRGANGRGCFATISTLAKICGYDTRTVKRALADLRDWKLIRSEKSKQDARRQVHRVVYMSEIDAIGDTQTPNNQSERGHPAHRKGASSNDVSQQYHMDEPLKQNSKQIKEEANPENRRPSYRKDAQPHSGRGNQRPFDEQVGTYLRQVEQDMRAMEAQERVEHANVIFGLLDTRLSHGETIYHWAERVMEELQWLNDSAAYDEAHGYA